MKYLLLALLLTLTACGPEPGVYAGGVRYPDGPLEVGRHHTLRFAERWRISHDWLVGTGTALYQCHYPGNPFRTVNRGGALAQDTDGPLLEINGDIYGGATFPSNPTQIVLFEQEDRTHGKISPLTGNFERYSPYCTFGMISPSVGISIYLIKPDPAKGTDEWTKGAQSIKLNDLDWLAQVRPVQDVSFYRSGTEPDHTVERWVLKIPDTPYWMVLSLIADSGASSKYTFGTAHHPEKWQRLQELFHQIVNSVRLEPITAVPLPPGLMVSEPDGKTRRPMN